MSEKPVVNAQECDPSTLGLARKPRPAMKRKPETEIVVQLGPFTDGQITAPEMVRPLEGPTEWLIKPKTGEIVPHDAGTPPDKDVIRKYITVGAQDTDVPEDLPKISEGYVVERVSQDVLPGMDSNVRENGTDTIRVVEREGPASVECESTPPNPPVTETEEPPPVDPPEEEHPPVDPPPVDPPVDEEEECEPDPYCPPVNEEEECETDPYCPPVDPPEEEHPPVDPPPVDPPVDEEEECEPDPYCPPVNEEEECETPVEDDCKTPVDAVNDCASTKVDCPVVIDVLKNDFGCGDLKITEASAENGSVEIKNGKLHYTPNEGFCGEDVISYTIGDENCMTDTAHVYMNVESGDSYGSGYDCDEPAGESSNPECPIDDGKYGNGKTSMHDYEFSSSHYSQDGSIFERADQILQDKFENASQLIQSKSGWASSYGSGNFDASASAPAEEPVAAC